jgi:transcriptional regulator with XRE-family HTH domain
MTKGMPPSATETAVRRKKLKQLGSTIRSHRSAKGWSQSDLARECWGEYENPRTGKKSAKNRDRISSIERGVSWPLPHTLAQIASKLGTTSVELAGEPAEDDQEIVSEGDKVRLKINRLVSFDLASRVMALLNGG